MCLFPGIIARSLHAVKDFCEQPCLHFVYYGNPSSILEHLFVPRDQAAVGPAFSGTLTFYTQGTVLMALLQPPPEVYNLFDDIMLLCEGVQLAQLPSPQASFLQCLTIFNFSFCNAGLIQLFLRQCFYLQKY